MLMIIYVCMYVCHCMIGIIRDHSREGIIAYAIEWPEEVPSLTTKQLGRIVTTNIQGKYHVDMI